MTGSELYTRTDIRRYWLYIPQFLFFTSAIVLLSVLNLSSNSVEIKRPAILLAGSVFALFNFKKYSRISFIAKMILLYIIEIFFNQLSGRVFHIQSFSVHLSLVAIVPLAISFMGYKFQKANVSSTERTDLLKSWAAIFIVIVLHMLFLFPLLRNIYGYGYEHNFAVFANMCLYFLVFVFSWEQLKNICLRRIAAIIFTIFFILVMVKGF